MSHAPTQRHDNHRPSAHVDDQVSVRVGTYTRWPSAREDDALQSYVASQPGWQTAMRFSDHASGATVDRPGLQQALEAARAGSIDVLLVHRVHRLAYKARHLAWLLEELNSHDVAFRSLVESFDTSTSVGRLQIQMLGSFARFEDEGAREDRRARLQGSRTRMIARSSQT